MEQFIGLDVSLKDTFISVREDGCGPACKRGSDAHLMTLRIMLARSALPGGGRAFRDHTFDV